MSTVHCTIDFVDCLQLSITLLILSTFFGFGRSLRSVVLQLTSNIQLILVHSCYPRYVNVIQDMLILVNPCQFFLSNIYVDCLQVESIGQSTEGRDLLLAKVCVNRRCHLYPLPCYYIYML